MTPRQNYFEAEKQRRSRIRLYAVALSISFGLLAAIFTSQLLQYQMSTVKQAAPRPELTVEILSANVDIPAGAQIQRYMIARTAWPEGEMPAGALISEQDVFGTEGMRRFAKVAISAGEPLLSSKMSAMQSRSALAHLLKPGMKAIAIRVDEVAGVAGFVLPGDHVDVLFTKREEDRESPEEGVLTDGTYTQTVLTNVRVLAIDQTKTFENPKARTARTVTVEVSSRDAKKVALTSFVGKLTLILRDPAEPDIGPDDGRLTLAQLFSGNSGDRALTSVGGAPPPIASPPANRGALPTGQSKTKSIRMRVIRVVTPTEYEVGTR